MRKLFWQMMVSLDGFMEGPNRELDWHVTDEDFTRYALEMLDGIDGVVLGRVTYELFAAYWPTATEPEAGRLNALEKIVFSRRLSEAAWRNTRVVNGEPAAEIARLKAQPGKDLALFGSAALASTLVRAGAIDEYRILVAPIVLGAGAPMFKDVAGRKPMRLVKSATFRSGVAVLHYVPAT